MIKSDFWKIIYFRKWKWLVFEVRERDRECLRYVNQRQNGLEIVLSNFDRNALSDGNETGGTYPRSQKYQVRPKIWQKLQIGWVFLHYEKKRRSFYLHLYNIISLFFIIFINMLI